MEKLRTFELLTRLSQAIQEQNQPLVNQYAYELALRIYVPNTSVSLEQLLSELGYKEIKKEEDRQISIDEYMRTRKD